MVKIRHIAWLEHSEYIHWDEKLENYVINNDAPDEIKEDYQLYLDEMKYWQKREEKTGANSI